MFLCVGGEVQIDWIVAATVCTPLECKAIRHLFILCCNTKHPGPSLPSPFREPVKGKDGCISRRALKASYYGERADFPRSPWASSLRASLS